MINFRNLIASVLEQNFNEILIYSNHRKLYPHSDFNKKLSPIFGITDSNSATLNLIVSTDGVNIKTSTFKKELWPVWLQVADLPPILRMARKNIVLAALFVGSQAPDWTTIVPHLRAELVSNAEVIVHGDYRLSVWLNCISIVTDMCAKEHVLNMFQFNGFFGCHYCDVEGVTLCRTHAYYPFSQKGAIRDSEVYEKYVKVAETMPGNDVQNIGGVKWKSAFSSIINGLPLSAPIDFMHCVLLGIFPELLKFCYRKLDFWNKEFLNAGVAKLACLQEMICYSRKIRSLKDIGQFKANEYFNWMFYVAPVLFRNSLPEILYKQLLNLSFGVRLLSKQALTQTFNWVNR